MTDLQAWPDSVPTYTLEKDYGAPSSGSVQTALQAAVVDLFTVKGGGRLLLRNRGYDFDAITWPVVGLDKPPPVVEFVGPFQPPTVGFMPGTGLTVAQGGDMPPPARGAILKASLASGSAFGNIATVSNIVPVFRNVVIRCPSNPQWHGIDGGWLTNLVLDNVVIDTGRSWGDGSNPLSAGPIQQPTNAGVIAAIMPGEGNGGLSRARDLLAAGFYTGLRHSEHFDGDRITIAKCVIGHAPTDGWHASRVGRESLYWNVIGLQPQNVNGAKPITPLQIDQLDFEEDPVGGNWYSTSYQVSDPDNLLRGAAPVRRMVPAAGPTTALKRRGGAYFNLRSLATPARDLFDAVGFHGVDSATVLPNSLLGQPPTQHRGAWGIAGKRAYLATRSNTALGDFAVWETGQTQVSLHTRVTVPAPSAQMNMGLALCAVDNANTLLAVLQAGACSIQKIDTGAFTNLSGNSGAISMVAGQEIDVRVMLTGRTIRLYVDGVLQRSYTLSAAEATKYLASTAHGLFAYTQGAAGEQGGGRWDFLRVESPGPLLA